MFFDVHCSKTGALLYSYSFNTSSIKICYAYKKDYSALITVNTFLKPHQIYKLNFLNTDKNNKTFSIEEIKYIKSKTPIINTSNFTVKQQFFTSKDGTQVNYFLLLYKLML